ncbi:MAG TPA: ABC transporter ATP-binding protein [Dehalococcoidia bacterium]|nr:ABC transporter ATP-binding protein [Dehalococcoidia bacterium]
MASENGRVLLEARDVVAGYGELDILHGVSVRVAEGEMVAVIGPNGAGKSTLLKAVFGLLPVRRGQVLVAGQEATNQSPDRLVERGLSYVPQTENVFPSLTINENLEMGAFLRRDGLRERLEQVYALFPDLGGRRQERAGRLSGGQRQRLALARALMLDPRVLLLDEPSASLSPKMVGMLFERIQAINEGGTAILLVEQNAREALGLCHRGYVLAMGYNRLEGEARGLLDNEEVGRLYLGA